MLTDARAELDAALISVGHRTDWQSLIELSEGFLDIARGDEAAAAERLERARTPATEGGASLIDVHDDARFVARIVEDPLHAS